jgi:hypothetical protein
VTKKLDKPYLVEGDPESPRVQMSKSNWDKATGVGFDEPSSPERLLCGVLAAQYIFISTTRSW